MFRMRAYGPAVDLTAFPRLDEQLAKNKLTRADLLDEVQEGIFNVRLANGSQKDRPRYHLNTRRWELTLHQEARYGNERELLAVVDNVSRRNGRPSEWNVPTVPSRVTLEPPRGSGSCDLNALLEEIRERRRLAEAERTLTRLRVTPRRHTALRAEVLRRYGSLRSLLELSKQRAEAGDKASSTGTVVDGRDWFTAADPRADELVVTLDRRMPLSGEEGCRLAVWREGEDPDRAPRLVLVEAADDLVVLALPDRPDQAHRIRRQFGPGVRVVVSEAEDFRYKRHLLALYDFLEEDVVGNWTSLAFLMCRPGDLVAPTSLPEIVPSDRLPLNSEQRCAVAGALTAPHAFFVQGPPGTGKTQVITDLVSRLTARGERVLLTAPTHVAVDEVLGRLADEPGVLPLRLSYKDTLVADEVRRFTKSGYDAMLARDLRTPATSKTAQWQAQLHEIVTERDALLHWRDISAAHQAAEQALAKAHATLQHNDRQRYQGRMEQTWQMDQVRHTATTWAQELTRLMAEDRAIERHLVALGPSQGPMARLLQRVGLGAASRAQRAQHAVHRKQMIATSNYLSAAQRYDEQLQRHDTAMAVFAEQEHSDRTHVADTEQTMAALRPQLDQARARLSHCGADHLRDDPSGTAHRLTELDAVKDKVSVLLDVQHRWFDLLGLIGHDKTSDHERAQEVVRRALRSAVNLVCSTTTGFGGDPDYRKLDYDTLIVDEASKVTGAEFLIPARRARRWIMVGDEKQLPPYVEPKDEHHIHALAAIHLADRDPRYTLSEAVRQLANLWKEHDDTELHPFRISSVEAIATRLLGDETLARAHKKTYTKQIRHISSKTETPEPELLRAMHEHLVTSLFEQCVAVVDDGLRCQLIYQQRMPAEIAELVRGPVYGGDYRTPPPTDKSPRPLISPSFPTPVVFVDTSAQPDPWDQNDGTSFINELEAKWVLGLCRQWNNDLRALPDQRQTTISVLAFYGAQIRLIRRLLGHPHYREFSELDFKVVDSIDRIQGQQSDIVIISFCRTFGKPKDPTRRPSQPRPAPAHYARWLQNINRLNVASTRARRSLVLVGHGNTLRGLNGVPAAEGFYRNLFKLSSQDGLTIRDDWVPGPTRRRRR